MFTLRKSNRHLSSRRQINIKGINEGVLLLPNNEYRILLEVSSLNFELKSELEQDSLIDAYRNFLNSLPCALQIIVRIRELDISKYLADTRLRYTSLNDSLWTNQIEDYCNFVQDLVEDNSLLSRRFYVVLPYSAINEDFALVKERLQLNADLVSKGLARFGMQTKKLNSIEILELFHSFYNPYSAKNQLLTYDIAHILNNSHTRIAANERNE